MPKQQQVVKDELEHFWRRKQQSIDKCIGYVPRRSKPVGSVRSMIAALYWAMWRANENRLDRSSDWLID